jgi:hypothetical protein
MRIVVRGLVDLVDDDLGGSRRPLQGTRAQVLDDLEALRAEGVTEVFFDLNLSPRIGFPRRRRRRGTRLRGARARRVRTRERVEVAPVGEKCAGA